MTKKGQTENDKMKSGRNAATGEFISKDASALTKTANKSTETKKKESNTRVETTIRKHADVFIRLRDK